MSTRTTRATKGGKKDGGSNPKTAKDLINEEEETPAPSKRRGDERTTRNSENNIPTRGSPGINSEAEHFTRSVVSERSTVTALKRRLKLQAEEQRAKIRKTAVQEQARLELELVDKRLEVQLAEVEEDEGDMHQATPLDNEGSYRERTIRDWLTSSVVEPVVQGGEERTVERATPASQPRDNGMEQLTQVLTQTLEAVQESRTPNNTTRHLMTRLTSMRDLPSFRGDPLEWPRFKRAFDLASENSGFNEEEKASRLYSCLKGEAREAVTSLMITSSNVTRIMETLQLRFGNPDQVLQKVIKQVKRLPRIDASRGNLVVFATTVRNCVAAMEAVNHLGYLHSHELTKEILGKMSTALVHLYNRYLKEKGQGEPRLVTLSNFLFDEAEMACKAGTNHVSEPGPTRSRRDDSRRTRNGEDRYNTRTKESVFATGGRNNPGKGAGSVPTKQSKCGYCSSPEHQITKCPRFTTRSVKERWEWAKRERLCFRCLLSQHRRNQCRATKCQHPECNKPHHQLLHYVNRATGEKKGNDEERRSSKSEGKREEEVAANTWVAVNKRVLLKVAPVWVEGPKGRVSTFALLDEGSTITLLDAKLATDLGIKGNRTKWLLRGVGNMESKMEDSERVDFDISGYNGGPKEQITAARTVRNLSLPCQSLTDVNIRNYQHLDAIDIECYSNAEPKVLIGQDNWDLIISLEIRQAGRTAPAASRTKLGWVIHGYVCPAQQRENSFQMIEGDVEGASPNNGEQEDLHALVKAYFKFDSMGITNVGRINKRDERAEHLLKSKTRRVDDRWETGLLWKNDTVSLPDSRRNATTRLKTLERKMDRDPDYKDAYEAQIEKLVKNGYARKLDDASNLKEQGWYLPHFSVANRDKSKGLRVVFDAAARSQGVSLNDALLSGPDLLNSLLGVLMRFRERRIAFTGDIKEMFLRIKILPEDQPFQRFLWRGRDRHRDPDTYIMTSMIFGATSSPCSALYVKNRNAQEFEAQYPGAVNAIIRKHYMDDYLDSADTVQEAVELIDNVAEIHKRGGFEIRGWASNSPKAVEHLPMAQLASGVIDFAFDDHPTTKTLGLKWDPRQDQFSFNLNVKQTSSDIISGATRPTKRQMLRIIMSIFDPHGFLTPFTIRSKILLQDVWRSGIQWDGQLGKREMETWLKWVTELKNLEHYSVPRCYVQSSEIPLRIELHVFCDASDKAYAAAAYWRYVYNNDRISVAFIAGKSRVAPLKPVSVPRLELQAALLGSRLARTIEAEHDIKLMKRTFWSDSRTVLQWIRADPRAYKMFVAHRLGEIDDLTNVSEWKWIPSKQNPADDATRITGGSLRSESRWIRGPTFLAETDEQWSKALGVSERSDNKEDCAIEEEKKTEIVTALKVGQQSDCLPDIQRFSSWLRLVRSTAWIVLFVHRCQKKATRNFSGELLREAEGLWIRRSQEESFPQELQALKRGLLIAGNSRIRRLAPFLDAAGLLRLQGRATALEGVAETAKNPVILCGRHAYTKLLILHYHQQAKHQSTETVINELRQKYWIVRLRPTVRAVASQCQLCRNQKARPQIPRMGDLPAARVGHHQRPFTYCGIDYFGPMMITSGRRQEKRWGVLLTCLTTRAIHLELAATLSADSAIMAIRRMSARRGIPQEIYSDNGTNFQGASAELRSAVKELDMGKMQSETANRGITWHFNPPYAPHMGGSWERLIRSVKIALKVTLKERAPKEEVLTTLLAEVEHTVNSRPLTHVSVDPRDLESLTPNHFLLGTSSGHMIPGSFNEDDLCLRKQWRISQRLADMFWSRWIREYMPTLLPRKRWFLESRELKVGDAVLIVDHTLQRNLWPRGRITGVYPGKDGRVRVVDVLTKGRTFRRAASKIVVLATH